MASGAKGCRFDPCPAYFNTQFFFIVNDEYWMELAFQEALRSAQNRDFPVGAVVVIDEEAISRAGNERYLSHSPLGHAEAIAITRAAEILGDWRLTQATVYVTMEPCPMCSGLMLQTRIKRLVYGVPSYREGCAGSVVNLLDYPGMAHHIEVCSGMLSKKISDLMQDFFLDSRS